MNAEFTRNLWLELTTHRLIAAPVLLLLLFALISAFNDYSPGPQVATAALVVFSALTALWGPHLATESVLEEVRAHTWDTQKLSALEPWSMTWGKLAGATIFTWYAGAICLAVYAFAAVDLGPVVQLQSIVATVSGAVLVQSAGFASALVMVHRGAVLKLRGGWLTLILVFAFLFIGLPIASADTARSVTWYGHAFRALGFAAATLAWLALSSTLWCWRVMCAELQVRTLPWALPAFIATATAYLAGFAPANGPWVPDSLRAGLALTAVAVVLTYLAAALEPKDAIAVQRLRLAWSAGAWRRVAEETPSWVLALVAATIGAAWSVLGGLRDGLDAGHDERYTVAAVAMLARDLALLHAFAFAAVPRRVEATTLLYLVVADGLLPALLGLLGAEWLAYAIFPIPLGPWPATAIFGLQFAVLVSIAGRRWRLRSAASTERTGG
jgi:hypothetical protein